MSQINANNADEAIRAWVDLIRRERPMGRASSHVARNISYWLNNDEKLVALNGLVDVWCIVAVSGGDLASINVIKSDH